MLLWTCSRKWGNLLYSHIYNLLRDRDGKPLILNLNSYIWIGRTPFVVSWIFILSDHHTLTDHTIALR
jgi:hypothetical protein